MADRKTKIVNFYESTLDSLLASGSTSTTLTAAPTTNGVTAINASSGDSSTHYYLVVDPDSSSNREVILVTQSTGTTLSAVTRDLENRHGTDPDHVKGTTVRMAVVAEQIEDVNDRIDADETTNAAHRSNTSNPHSVTAVQVGAATTSNSLSDFAVPTGDLNINNNKLTNVSNPTSAQDAATKNWVESQGFADIGLIIALG